MADMPGVPFSWCHCPLCAQPPAGRRCGRDPRPGPRARKQLACRVPDARCAHALFEPSPLARRPTNGLAASPSRLAPLSGLAPPLTGAPCGLSSGNAPLAMRRWQRRASPHCGVSALSACGYRTTRSATRTGDMNRTGRGHTAAERETAQPRLAQGAAGSDCLVTTSAYSGLSYRLVIVRPNLHADAHRQYRPTELD
jgi:hypothetical protein